MRARIEPRAAITFSDNGPGIPPEEREAVFRRLYRGTRAAQRGLGLGLSLVKAIAEAHGERSH